MYDVHLDVSTTCVEECGEIRRKMIMLMRIMHEEEEVADIDHAGILWCMISSSRTSYLGLFFLTLWLVEKL
jgi:hypothetical protein